MKTKDQSNGSARTSRRKFTKSVAAALVTTQLTASLAHAQQPSKPKQATAPPNPQPSPTPQEPSPLAEAYAEVARLRFGDQVTPEQLAQIKKDLDGYVRAAERLRSVKLKNEEEPDFIFIAD